MDGDPAIEANREALRRIVATLAEMAGLAEGPEADKQAYASDSPLTASRSLSLGLPEARPEGSAPLPLKEGEEKGAASPPFPLPRRSGETAKRVGEGVDLKHGAAEGKPRPLTIPRILWTAILRVLRPAESAARRLIIAAARGLTVAPPRPRKAAPKPAMDLTPYRRLGLAVRVMPGAAAVARREEADRGTADRGAARIPAFPLFDAPRRFALFGPRRRTVPPHAAPRIMYPGLIEPHRLPPPPAPGDLVGAERLTRRIAALTAALDDLPGQARRYARWKAARDAAQAGQGPPRRVSPIRRWRPPGGRLFRFDPDVTHPKNIREVDEILAHAHALALYALDYPDTS